MKKKALITGITGQDGSYLAEFLLEKGYEVHGMVRRVDLEDPERHMWRIQHLVDRVNLHIGSLESYAGIFRMAMEVKPDECYHLAAKSFVSYAFDDEFSTITTNINGTHFILTAIKESNPSCRFYFAGSSEMFGAPDETPQNEKTPFHPRSLYGISKLAGFHLTWNFRRTYDLFACNGILYNHESERRGFEFVTRKISDAVAKIKLGLSDKLILGNLDARRDWGYAPEYTRAMWLMLQQDKPGDFVIATGKTHSVREFVSLAFECVDLEWEDFVEIDEALYRPTGTVELRGDANYARKQLGWQPEVSFEELVRLMVKSDMDLVRRKFRET